MEITVRSAVADDTDAVYELLKTIAALHREARPEMYPDLVSKYKPEELRSRFEAPDSGVFVAVSDNAVVGYIFCDVIKEGSCKTLYIDDLCVSASSRRGGVGSALMSRAEEYAKEKHCDSLMLNVWEFNRTAVEFYEKCGYKTRTRHMEKFLK